MSRGKIFFRHTKGFRDYTVLLNLKQTTQKKSTNIVIKKGYSYIQNTSFSLRNHLKVGKGFPPCDTQPIVNFLPVSIGVPSMYPVIVGGSGGSTREKINIIRKAMYFIL